MPKLIAGVLIVISSFLIGGALSEYYKKRIKFFRDYLDFIAYAEGEIGFYKREIKDLILKFTDGRTGEFCSYIKEKYIDCNTKHRDEYPIVDEFITGLSDLNTEFAAGYFKLGKERAECELSREEKNYETKGALGRKLFPLAGAAVFIILI